MSPQLQSTPWTECRLDLIQAPDKYSFVGGPFGSDLTSKDYVTQPGVPVIRGTNLGGAESRFIDDGFVYVSDDKADSLSRNLAFPGDLVFTQRGTLGQVALIPEKPRFTRYVISQSQMKLKVDPNKADRRYVYYACRSPGSLRRLLSRTQATGVPHINLGILKEFTIPLPPLPEQKRIADILDKADAIRRKRQEALDSLHILRKSQFDKWFSEFFSPLATLSHVPVSYFVKRFEGGLNVATPESPSKDTRDFVLKVSAVTSGDYRPDECKPLYPDYFPPPQHFVREGDVLFSRANTTELVGATVYVYETPSNRVLPDKLWRFIWKDETQVEPLFVWALFNHPQIRYEIGRRATGTSGSMKNISMEKVMSITVPWPELTVQRTFAAFLRQERVLRQKMHLSLNDANLVFNSLVQRSFQGEL